MTTSTSTLTATTPTTFSTANKVGLGLATVLAVGDVLSALAAQSFSKAGPPVSVIALDCLLGVVTLVAVGFALARRSRGATRIAAAARIVSAISAMPAFFVDVSPGITLLAGADVLVTVLVVVMILSPARSTTSRP